MVRPAEDVNRIVRTVIEAADPALEPVHKLRRFVVKRLEFVAPPPAEEPSEPSAASKPRKQPTKRKPTQRQTESSGLRK